MRDYEVVYIFDSTLPEERISEKLDHYHSWVTDDAADNAGEITAVDHWGKRQLTYPIRKKANGYYVVVQFRGESTALPEFERVLKLDEELLRYLIVLNEGQPTAPMSLATREPGEGDEHDEDEDEEEE